MQRLTIWICVIGAALATLPGCGSGRATRPSDHVSLYEAGRYRDAFEAARQAERDAPRRERSGAALTAGLAAHALGEHHEAKTHLEPLVDDPDREIAGRAEAALGLIAASEGDYELAASLLTTAARKLEGDDAALALIHAGDASTELGRPETAQANYRRASGVARSTLVRLQATERIERGTFTIQLGAFSLRENAEARAGEAGAISRGLGLGEPMVLEGNASSGVWMYFVRVGSFGTRQEATGARTRLGLGGVVVSSADLP